MRNKKNRRKKIRFLRSFAILNITLLVINILSYFFVSRQSVPEIQAEETLYCMKICEIGAASCDFGTCANKPSVTTTSISEITTTTAMGNGNITSDGGDTVSERGFVLSTFTDPTISDTTYTTDGTTGDFSVSLTGLSSNTNYYARAYATNGAGTGYGDNFLFTTLSQTQGEATPEVRILGGGPPSPLATAPVVSPPAASPPTYNVIDYLVSSHPEKQPYVIIETMEIIGSRQEKIEQGQIPASTYQEGFTTFRGRTNIKNAIIIITLNSPQTFYATTRADENGYWSWTTPEILLPGQHQITVMSVSLDNPLVREISTQEFLIEPPKKIIPQKEGTGKKEVLKSKIQEPKAGEILPPIYLPPPSLSSEWYALDVKLDIPEKGITPTNIIDVKSEIISFDKENIESLELVYSIYDSKGNRIYMQKKEIAVKEKLEDISRISTAFTLLPGDYVITAEILWGEKKIISSRPFTVEPYKIELGMGISIPQKQMQKSLAYSLIFFSMSLVFFSSLLYGEYIKAKKEPHITERDLWKQGDII